MCSGVFLTCCEVDCFSQSAGCFLSPPTLGDTELLLYPGACLSGRMAQQQKKPAGRTMHARRTAPTVYCTMPGLAQAFNIGTHLSVSTFESGPYANLQL
jgi:hypothetical protein